MRKALTSIAPAFAALVLLRGAVPAPAQTGQWLTFGHDPQRSGWATDEQTFNPQNVARLALLWKVTVPNQPLALNGLLAPLVIKDVETTSGHKTLVIVAGSSNHVYALDSVSGATVWKQDFKITDKPKDPPMWLCPNALNDTPVIDPERGRVFVISADGRLHTLALRDGSEQVPAYRMVPPYSKMWSLNYSGGWLYTSISQDCAGVHSGIVAVNPDAPGHPVTTFWSAQNGAGIWGRGGPAVDFNGGIYGSTGDAPVKPDAGEFGDSVLRLQPRTLDLADYFTAPNWEYVTRLDLDMGTSTPVIFRWNDRVLTAVGGKECVAVVNDTSNLGGPNHQTAAYTSPRLCNDDQMFEREGIWGAMSSWSDETGTVWLYVPTWGPLAAKGPAFPVSNGSTRSGRIEAFKVVGGRGGAPALQPAWLSPDIAVPDPAAIAGGVVFVVGTGENTQQVYNGDINKIVPDRTTLKSGHLIVHALDAKTGHELWNSGDTITDWTHFTGTVVADGKVFAVTHEGGVYAFGLR